MPALQRKESLEVRITRTAYPGKSSCRGHSAQAAANSAGGSHGGGKSGGGGGNGGGKSNR